MKHSGRPLKNVNNTWIYSFSGCKIAKTVGEVLRGKGIKEESNVWRREHNPRNTHNRCASVHLLSLC